MVVLYSCGSNAQGQLGHGTLDDSDVLRACEFVLYDPDERIADVRDMAMGANHTIALVEVVNESTGTSRTEIWGSGDGRAGQLGRAFEPPEMLDSQGSKGDQPVSRTRFEKISFAGSTTGLPDGFCVSAIAATWETSYAVLSCEGRADVVISFGSNQFGDLGIGTGATVGSQQPRGGTDDDAPAFSVVRFPDGLLTPRTKVAFLVGGQRHVVVGLCDRDGSSTTETRVFGWGSCRHGQLGPPPNPKASFLSSPTLILNLPDSVTSAALGIQHSIFRCEDGSLVGLGSNRKHQLDVVTSNESSNTLSATTTWNGTYVLSEEGGSVALRASGSNAHHQLGQGDAETASAPVRISFPPSVSEAEISCGSEHVLALLAQDGGNGEVWGWGWNEHGNLGVGNTIDVTRPTKIWPREEKVIEGRFPARIWGGLGTSWILCRAKS